MPAKKSQVTMLKETMMAMDEDAAIAYHQKLSSENSENSDNTLIESVIQAMARDIKKRFKKGDLLALEHARRFISFTKKTERLDNSHKMGGFAYGLIRKYEGKNGGEQVLKMARKLRLFYEQTLSNTFPKKP